MSSWCGCFCTYFRMSAAFWALAGVSSQPDMSESCHQQGILVRDCEYHLNLLLSVWRSNTSTPTHPQWPSTSPVTNIKLKCYQNTYIILHQWKHVWVAGLSFLSIMLALNDLGVFFLVFPWGCHGLDWDGLWASPSPQAIFCPYVVYRLAIHAPTIHPWLCI